MIRIYNPGRIPVKKRKQKPPEEEEIAECLPPPPQPLWWRIAKWTFAVVTLTALAFSPVLWVLAILMMVAAMSGPFYRSK